MTFKQAVRIMILFNRPIGVRGIYIPTNEISVGAMSNQDYESLKYWLTYDYSNSSNIRDVTDRLNFIDRLESNDWYIE